MRHRHAGLGNLAEAAIALTRAQGVIAAVKNEPEQDPKMAAAIAILRVVSRKEAIPLAIIGGLAAIHHGYERLTTDVDVVVPRESLDIITRVAPKYGIKVIWSDPHGWHKLRYEGVKIDVVPEGGKPWPDAPTTIPGPKELGTPDGCGYARLGGWMETKLASYRRRDQADVVQVMKKTTPAMLARARKHLEKVHRLYVARFDELHTAAKEERQQERERGGER